MKIKVKLGLRNEKDIILNKLQNLKNMQQKEKNNMIENDMYFDNYTIYPAEELSNLASDIEKNICSIKNYDEFLKEISNFKIIKKEMNKIYLEFDDDISFAIQYKAENDILISLNIFEISSKKDNLTLGNPNKETNLNFTFSINNLYKKFFDLLSLEPDTNKWSKDNFKNNEPRLYRYLQLIALFEVFDLPSDMTKFINGSFLDQDKSSEFKILLKYRIQLVKPLSYTAGVYAISHPLDKTYNLILEANNNILKEIKKIDEILINLIAPKNKIFTKDELIEKYNYPDINLEQIDMDNF